MELNGDAGTDTILLEHVGNDVGGVEITGGSGNDQITVQGELPVTLEVYGGEFPDEPLPPGEDGDDQITLNSNNLTFAEQAQLDESIVTFFGGDGSDSYTINLGSTESAEPAVCNDPLLCVPEFEQTYRVEDTASMGSDTLTVNGTPGNDHIDKDGDIASLTPTFSDRYEVVALIGIEQTTIDGMAGNDVIEDPGSDTTLLGHRYPSNCPLDTRVDLVASNCALVTC